MVNKFKYLNKINILFLFFIMTLNINGCSITLKREITNDTENSINMKININEKYDYEPGDVLPLGSIVTLKNSNDKLMIYGWNQNIQNENKMYDYIACDYPIGAIDKYGLHLFDQNEIEAVYYVGYMDEDGKDYINGLIEFRNKLKNQNYKNCDNYSYEDIKYDLNQYNLDLFLPLGSIVEIRNDNNKYLITGRMCYSMDDKDKKMNDYCGYKYPEGYKGRDSVYIFNMEDITKIYFRGYSDNIEDEYTKKLSDYRKTLN